ncbi:glycosyl hydrolase family 28-related protein [Pontiellaceae bacterium B12227]|nr:glycosyl hydrolase family 28-related protein [Pontiellaceae bacterium B12227]
MESVMAATLAATTGCATAEQRLGASKAWKNYPAEEAHTNGKVLEPSRTYLTPQAEALGRSCVRLDELDEYIEFQVEDSANALVMRFCIPDGLDGEGTNATLSLEINGNFVKKLELTSRYAWIYGDFPWSNHPSAGKDHHFWDECRTFVPQVKPGDRIRLVRGEGDDAEYYLIDFIELEQVAPPLARPENSLSINDFSCLLECIEAAKTQDKVVWIPPGQHRHEGDRIQVGGVHVQGAGMWHSSLTGTPMFEGTGEAVHFSDLALFGEIGHRDDESPDNAFNGNLGDGSVFSNLWIEHLKCGFWTKHGTKNMLLENSRIRNLMADGLNFCDGTSYSTVRNCHFRNTGDDALASWSPSGEWSSGKPCINNSFIGNSIELPWLANGIAIYGGKDHVIASNEIHETVFSGGGILISSNFKAVSMAGKIRVENNRIHGAGGDSHIGERVGGLWLHAADSDVGAEILIDGLEITESAGANITFHGKYGFRKIEMKNIRH